MRTIEQSFAKIDQLLVTLERVLISTPEPAEEPRITLRTPSRERPTSGHSD